MSKTWIALISSRVMPEMLPTRTLRANGDCSNQTLSESPLLLIEIASSNKAEKINGVPASKFRPGWPLRQVACLAYIGVQEDSGGIITRSRARKNAECENGLPRDKQFCQAQERALAQGRPRYGHRVRWSRRKAVLHSTYLVGRLEIECPARLGAVPRKA